MDFKEWLDMRIEEGVNKRLFSEIGEGIWINPDDAVYRFRGILHAEWAESHGLDMNEMMRSGWVRMRTMPDGTAFAETNRHSALHQIVAVADDDGVKNVQLFLKGREFSLHKEEQGWMLGDQPLGDVFESKKGT